MKKLLLALLTVLFLTGTASAAVGTFPISVTIPAATTVNFVVSKVTGTTTPIFSANPTSNNLNFDVGFNTLNSIYLGNEYFAIDLAPNGAANYTSITFGYGSQTVPAGQTSGLNNHATVTPVKVVGTVETPLAGFGVPLGNASSITLNNSSVAGGFLRVYVGLATGELTGGAGTPARIPGSVPFSGADLPGAYSGTLTITATLT